MKQMLIRVDDELHTAISQTAQESGDSINAVANKILAAGVGKPLDSPRERVRLRALTLGMLAPPHTDAPPPSQEEYDAFLETTKGIGPVIDEILEEDRGRLDRLR